MPINCPKCGRRIPARDSGVSVQVVILSVAAAIAGSAFVTIKLQHQAGPQPREASFTPGDPVVSARPAERPKKDPDPDLDAGGASGVTYTTSLSELPGAKDADSLVLGKILSEWLDAAIAAREARIEYLGILISIGILPEHHFNDDLLQPLAPLPQGWEERARNAGFLREEVEGALGSYAGSVASAERWRARWYEEGGK